MKVESAIESLPVKITRDGQDFYLRIKARDNGKKWVIRYLGKRQDSKLYLNRDKIRGFTYKTYKQFWGNNLENTAKRVLKYLEDNK